MKSPHKLFDDELKERLQQYTEEPNETLWQGIASKISINHEPNWVGWSQRISGAVVIGITMLVGVLQFGIEKIDVGMFNASLHEVQTRNNEKGKTVTEPRGNKLTSPDNSIKRKTDLSQNEVVINNSTKGSREDKPFSHRVNNDHAQVTIESTSEELAEEVKNEGNQSITIEAIAIESNQIKKEKSESSTIRNDTSKIISQQVIEPDTVIESDTTIAVRKQPNGIKKKGQRQKRYTLYFTAMPTFGYQRVESNQNDNIIIQSIHKISAFSTDRLGVRAEFGAEFPFLNSKKLIQFSYLC